MKKLYITLWVSLRCLQNGNKAVRHGKPGVVYHDNFNYVSDNEIKSILLQHQSFRPNPMLWNISTLSFTMLPLQIFIIILFKNKTKPGFPGGSVVKNLPANARDTVSISDPGRSRMPRSN